MLVVRLPNLGVVFCRAVGGICGVLVVFQTFERGIVVVCRQLVVFAEGMRIDTTIRSKCKSLSIS